MSYAVKNLRVNDVVDVLFKGSRSLGNEPYTLEDLQVVGVGEDRVTLSEEGFEFDIYKYGLRWAYGSSAEPLSVLARHRP